MPCYVAWALALGNGRLGGVFIGPNTNLAVGEKLCSLWHTGQFGGAPDIALFIVRCAKPFV
jgi:hypothetical protein